MESRNDNFFTEQLENLVKSVNSLANNYNELGEKHHKKDVDNLVQQINAIQAQQTAPVDKYLQAASLVTSSYFNSFLHFEKGLGRQASSFFGLKAKDFTDKFITKLNTHPNKSHFTRMLGLIVKNSILNNHANLFRHLESAEINKDRLNDFEGHYRSALSAEKIVDHGKYRNLTQADIKEEKTNDFTPRKT